MGRPGGRCALSFCKEWLSGTIQCPVARIGCAVNQLSVQVDGFQHGQTLGPPPAISQAVPAAETG